MNKEELVECLEELAATDLADGADYRDHPCSVAIRAIEQCYSDIKLLRSLVPNKKQGSKRVQMLLGLNYNPSW